MTEGRRFAYRERAHTPGNPVRAVELVKDGPPRSQKVKVRWLDGDYEGLEEWVPKVRLVVPWDEKEAFLEDERGTFAALEASGDVYGTATYRAVQTVYFAVPQESGAEVLLGLRAAERELLSIDGLEAVATRLGLDAEALLSEPHSYVDRCGESSSPGTSTRPAHDGLTMRPTASGPRPGWRSWDRSSPSLGSGVGKKPRRSSMR